jgi:hypothetical protein
LQARRLLDDGVVSRGYVVKSRDPDDQRAVKLDSRALRKLTEGLNAMLSAVDEVDESLGAQPFPFML